MTRSPSELRTRLEGDVVGAAHALLGCFLTRGDRLARIVEVEAYRGRDDPGSHAFRGKTPRNLVMFGPAARAYVYFTYGCHWMLNVTAEQEGEAGAVLVRAAQPIQGLDSMRRLRPKAQGDHGLLSGPGKLASAFGITGLDNGRDLLDGSYELQIIPGEPVDEVLTGKRIGLSPGRGDETPWRFVHAPFTKWISRPL